MKTVALIVIFIIATASSAYSQVSNAERLEQIKIEINTAIEQNDFERAATLKRERDLRLEIKAAIENKEFARAAELKEQIENKPNPMKASQEPTVAETGGEDKKPVTSSEESTSAPSRPLPLNNMTWYRATKSGVYINGTVGSIRVGSGLTSLNGVAGGVRGGAKIFFGDKENSTRAGLDIMVCSAISSEFGVDLSLANTGFTLATAFTRKSGFEFGFVTGAHMFIGYTAIQSVIPGLTINPQFKFRFSFVDIGAHLVYSSALGYNIQNLYIGGIAGFKF